jgi:hypothetical protein
MQSFSQSIGMAAALYSLLSDSHKSLVSAAKGFVVFTTITNGFPEASSCMTVSLSAAS